MWFFQPIKYVGFIDISFVLKSIIEMTGKIRYSFYQYLDWRDCLGFSSVKPFDWYIMGRDGLDMKVIRCNQEFTVSEKLKKAFHPIKSSLNLIYEFLKHETNYWSK